MRKGIVWTAVMLMLLCASCGKQEEQKVKAEPQEAQARSICELATMECYYHNVARYNEEDAEGVLWWKKDKNFWIEYAGVVEIGIDASLVDIKVADELVTITIPPAKILGCRVDENTLSESSFIIAKDSAKVEAEDQTEAFREAQSRMEQAASEDRALLESARQRAQKLLEDYVNNLGESTGVPYKINWIYLDEDENGGTRKETEALEPESE